MHHATALSPEVRRVFRRLLILGQARGLESESIVRAAAQARAHFESLSGSSVSRDVGAR